MYDGRNGFGYQPIKADKGTSSPPMDECRTSKYEETMLGQRYFKPPLASEIISPSRWKESDKLWASYYSNLLTECENERLLRTHYQGMSEILQKENSFLMDVLNRVVNGESL